MTHHLVDSRTSPRGGKGLPTAARRLGIVVSVVLIGAAGWLLVRELRGLRFGAVVGYLGTVSPGWLLVALVGTVAAYVALVGYDALALRHVGHPLPWRRVVRVGLIGFGISNTAGQVWLAGGAVRYRLYRAAGLAAGEIAGVVVFVSLAFWLGYLALAGVVFPLAAPGVPPSLRLGVPLDTLGWVCLALVGAYLAWCGLGQDQARLRPPALRVALPQVGVAVLRTLLTASVLYAVLPEGVDYLAVLGVFVFAVGIATLGQVPGAAGVLEAVVLVALPALDPAAAVGALVLFRLLYYLLPLAAALVALTFSELHPRPGGAS
ncbi:UPF0104 family protein [Pseudonocardia sp. C8]|uniref:YbhN family protein n=1 Tax=Saccharopolyspora cebuensis TaxID=418759 RepID=A0ABV4CBS2_9PSEU|nr:YbhN family protein [Pseudonocardia sp. C8]MBC3193919.1 UPF0104 family protein [Pseudonocardia sp. C8]